MRIHCFQHVPFEGPAAIADWAERRGHAIAITPLYERTALPEPERFDWLVVMGGPMGVHDEADHPWMAAEKRCIAASIAAGKRVIGVCLGAQLIAEALGARVYRNPEKEIGWFPIELTEAGRVSPLTDFLPPSLEVFHWHGDTFEPPPGAIQLARSAVCEQQAFLYDGRVLGLQCHLEATSDSVRDIVANCADEIQPANAVQSAERLLAATEADYARIHGALFGMLDRLAESPA
ncbi:type 1 glutamine amidotransferase [Thiocystis violacea]|uniref:type 1 glutamine amidotransferase n=1 Tax=Thiocystis violacea TaxID=13725 RepID=UPI0019080E77|nr:type 1 glutamine amidotransferase [Thiocystis violacea]MBK1720371.1 amidotransferase [Thiocystis violacea]